MSRHSDLVSGSKELGTSIAHTIKIELTTRPESVNFMRHEEETYREQALLKLFKHSWNDSEKKEIELKAIKRINEIFNEPKNQDIRAKISEKDIEQKVKQQLVQLFRAIN